MIHFLILNEEISILIEYASKCLAAASAESGKLTKALSIIMMQAHDPTTAKNKNILEFIIPFL